MKEIQKRDGKIQVSRTIHDRLAKQGFEVQNEEKTIEIRPFATNPASISIKKGVTIDLGNYQSSRIDVMVTLPCYSEEILEVAEALGKKVDELLTKESRETVRWAKKRFA